MGTIPGPSAEPPGRELKKLSLDANAAMEAGNIYVVLHHFPLTGLLQETLRSAGSGLRGHARARAKGEVLSENASPIMCPFLCKPGQATGCTERPSLILGHPDAPARRQKQAIRMRAGDEGVKKPFERKWPRITSEGGAPAQEAVGRPMRR
jgi:hypothetical protein